LIIDFHTHIFPPEVIARREVYLERDRWFGELYSSPRARMATAEELVAALDEAGADRAVACGFAWADPGLCRMHNDYLIEAVRRYPERLIGFISVTPRHPREAVEEISRCAAKGLRGIGELMPNGQGFTLDDEAVMGPLAEAATAHGLPVLVHTSEPVGHLYHGKGTVYPQQVYALAQLFPALTVICAHWGGGLPFYELMPEVREALRDVYYDTAASPFLYEDRIFPLLFPLVGHKILFGSDFPLLKIGRFIKRIRESGLSPEQVEMVLGENAQRLLVRKFGSFAKNYNLRRDQ